MDYVGGAPPRTRRMAKGLGQCRLATLARAVDEDDGRVRQRLAQPGQHIAGIEAWTNHRPIVSFGYGYSQV